ncbi:MAG: PASTA domain-containing protein [Mycoplasmatota bacterium]
MKDKKEKTTAFDEVITRAERQKKELENTKPLEKTLEETKKIEDLKKSLDFDDKKKKRSKKDKEYDIPYVEEIEKTLRMNKIDDSFQIKKKKTKFDFILSLIVFIISLGAIIYLIFSYSDYININYLLINSSILSLISLFSCLFVKTKKKILNIFNSLFILIFIIFNMLVNLEILNIPTNMTLPSFNTYNIGEVIEFTNNYDIELITNYEYSDYVDEYNIITQDINDGTLLKNVDTITVLVSQGPNLEKTVTVPTLTTYNLDTVVEFIEENFLSNVIINFEMSDDVSKDYVISQSYTGEMKRNDELTIVVSLGTESDIVPVEMIDLSNMSEFNATLWLKQNSIPYNLSYDFSDTILKDYVISQNIETGTTVDSSSSVTLVVSKGNEITLPDFSQMSVDTATTWIINNNLKVTFEEVYDVEYIKGAIINANYEKNDVVEEGTTINLTISKGPLVLEEFSSVFDFKQWADDYSLTYIIEEEYSDEIEANNIISISPNFGTNLATSQEITVVVSKGKSATVPNFYNLSLSAAKTACSNAGLVCTYSYYYHSSISENYSYSQSMTSGSIVPEGTSVKIYISKGVEPVVPDTSGGSSDSNNDSNSGNTCTSTASYTLYLQPDWVTSGSAATTISTLTEKLSSSYPNITFKYELKASNLKSGLIHVDSTITTGSTITDCNTYTIIINE